MKGPYERLKYNLHRVWECPKCEQRQRTDSTVTGLQCPCQLGLTEDQRVSMTLLQDGIRRSKVKQPTASATKAAAADTPEVNAESTTAETTTAETTTAESTTAESTTAESTTAESTTAESTTDPAQTDTSKSQSN